MDAIPQIPITVCLQIPHSPAVFDLSGNYILDAYLDVRRPGRSDDDPRPLTLRTDGSLFDIPYAFAHDFFELIDIESGSKVDINLPSPVPNAGPECFVTLRSRASKEARRGVHRYDYVQPLHVWEHLKTSVKEGREYRLQLRTLDLGVKWWNYGSKEDLTDPLPPSSAGKLVADAVRANAQSFLVTSSLPTPPPVSISLSLSPNNTVRRSGEPPTTLRVEVTNQGSQPITVKSTGEQPYFSSRDLISPGGVSTIPRITHTSTPLRIQIFHIYRAGSEEDLVHDPNRNMCGLPGLHSKGWPRSVFTTLEPGVPFIREREMLFLVNGTTLKERMSEDGEYRLKLRSEGVWWCFGTMNELFGGEDEKFLKRLPQHPAPPVPLMLASDDEVTFFLEN